MNTKNLKPKGAAFENGASEAAPPTHSQAHPQAQPQAHAQPQAQPQSQPKPQPTISYQDPVGSFSAFQFPNAFRDIAEKSVSQARDTYARWKTAAEDATDIVESTVEAAREGAFALSVKALDAAKTNSDTSFALARDLFGARTFSEVIELQSTYARRLFESVTSQVKEFQELTQKVVTDTTKPVAQKVEKSLKTASAA